jgi:uncharacterized protein
VIVLDTGVLLAAADADDNRHDDAINFFDHHDLDDLVLPATVVTETSWRIESRLDAATEAAFIGSIAAGDFHLVELTPC